MTWWAWTVAGLACWVLVCLILVVAWIATIEWHRRRRDPQTPAGGEPPNPRGVRSPLPGQPRKILDVRIIAWDCTCSISRNNLTGRQHDHLCERHAFAAEWNQRLAQS